MKLAEKVLVLFAAGGLFLKFSGEMYGGIVTLSSFATLALLYLFGGFLLFRSEGLKTHRYIWFPVSVVIVLVLIASFLKIQYWYAAPLAVYPAAIIILLLTLYFLLRYRNQPSALYLPFLHRLVPFCLFMQVIAITPMSAMIRLQYRHDPVLADLKVKAYVDPADEASAENLYNYEHRRK